jgi:hypothetical protein
MSDWLSTSQVSELHSLAQEPAAIAIQAARGAKRVFVQRASAMALRMEWAQGRRESPRSLDYQLLRQCLPNRLIQTFLVQVRWRSPKPRRWLRQYELIFAWSSRTPLRKCAAEPVFWFNVACITQFRRKIRD